MRTLKLGPIPAQEERFADPDAMIENYLDHLCGPLIGLVPHLDRVRFRDEAKFNIEGRMDMYLRDGMPPLDAAREAIEKYGDSKELSDRFLAEWMQHQQTGLFRQLGKSNAYAGMFFSQATFLALLILIWRIYVPSTAKYKINIDEVRTYLPPPIPIPDAGSQTWVFFGVLIFAPIVAGWLTGQFAIVHAAQAVFRAQVLLTLGTFFLGSAMLPQTDGIFVALVQLLWWLPAGCLTAHLAAAEAWRRRCANHSFPKGGNHD